MVPVRRLLLAAMLSVLLTGSTLATPLPATAPPPAASSPTSAVTASTPPAFLSSSSASVSGRAPNRPIPTDTPIPTIAQAKAWMYATLGPDDAACLDSIVSGESNWQIVWNRTGSGAYGLGQAKPPEKMAPYGADYMTNPITQLRWAISYGRERYGSLCNAVYFRSGWYDRHGVLHPGSGWW